MRLEWRRLRTGEVDHELIWLTVTVAAAGAGLLWLWLQLPWPRCSWRALTGLPCVTCGATRAAVTLLHGDLHAAWRFNPLVFAGLFGVGVYDLYALIVLAARTKRLRVQITGSTARLFALTVLLTLGALNWIYLLRQ